MAGREAVAEDVSRLFADSCQPTDTDIVSDLKDFLNANGLPESPCLSALRLGNKLLELECQMDLDVRGLLVFCPSNLWHVNYDELPALVQKLESDKTLTALVKRHKGWFCEAAARYESTMILVFQQNMPSLMSPSQKKFSRAAPLLALHHSDSARMSSSGLHVVRDSTE